MSDTPHRLADVLRLAPSERRIAFRKAIARPENRVGLRAEIRDATTLGKPSAAVAMAAGWQERILDNLRRQEADAAAEREEAEALFARLLEQPTARRYTLVCNSRKYHTWSLCRLIAKHSVEALFRDPQEGLELAILATRIADGTFVTVASQALLHDLQGNAWTYRGNAHRAVSQFAEAEEAFGRARRHLEQGTGDPLERALLAEYRASLRFKQRRFEESVRLFEQAAKLRLSVGERHGAGVALLGRAAAVLENGNAEESMRLHRQALEMLDPKRDPRLQVMARQNIAVCLKDRGAFREAAAEIPALRKANAALGDSISLLRLRKLEADIAFGEGRAHDGVVELDLVRNEFARHGMLHDFADVTLDLAAHHLQLGQLAETKRLASESLPLFRSLGVHREAIAAFLVFQEAAEREAATVDLVREIATYLRAARANPELKFRGA